MTITKENVTFHADWNSPARPALNVKVRGLQHWDAVQKRFNCTGKIAEQALEFAWRTAQDRFWNDDSQEIARRIFGSDAEVFSEGRSGGWLVVSGIPDFEDWDESMFQKWAQFESEIRETIESLTSEKSMLDDIEANRWAEEGAQLYNWIDGASGNLVCVVDLNRVAEQARKDYLAAH